MNRWSGVLKIRLHRNSDEVYTIAASLGLSSSFPHTLAVPSNNAIFFGGDRVEATGNPVIERLSDPKTIAEVLVSKFGGSVNVFTLEASVFNGPFTVYRDFVPSVNEVGEPRSYDATGFTASTSLLLLLANFLAQAKNIILGKQKEPCLAQMPTTPHPLKPKTTLVGFSKGGIILNQLMTELASSQLQPTEFPKELPNNEFEHIIPTSKEGLLNSISEIHYVDVGLNSEGAYLNSKEVIDKICERVSKREFGIRFVLHGTPRQWRDERRIWIRKEKDALLRLLKGAASRDVMGKVKFRERLYFPHRLPDMQMHFEIIDMLDVS